MKDVAELEETAQDPEATVIDYRLGRRPTRIGAAVLWGYDAFISYSRGDALKYAARLWESLEREGLVVAFDHSDLNAGDSLSPSLKRAIRRSRYLFLVDTPGARESTYVGEEVAHAFVLNRHIVRIVFPLTPESGWGVLAPFHEQLEQDIWLLDHGDPKRDGPTPRSVAELVKLHRTRRVRRNFVLTVAVALAAAIAASSVFLLSRDAHRRVAEAVEMFRDPEASFETADARARELFSARRYPVSDLFAAAEHTQLRNVMTTAVLKRRLRAGEPPSNRRVPCPNLLADLLTDTDFPYCAVDPQRLRAVVATAGSLRLFARHDANATFDEVTSRSMNSIKGVEFSETGDFVAVVWEPRSEPARLALLDSRSGVLLQEETLMARLSSQGSDRSADCAAALWVTAEWVGTCLESAVEWFEVRRQSPVSTGYWTRETSLQLIAGAVSSRDGRVAFWTVHNSVALCHAPQAGCDIVIGTGEAPAGLQLDRPLALRGAALPAGPRGVSTLLVQDSLGISRCDYSDKAGVRCEPEAGTPLKLVAGAVLAREPSGDQLAVPAGADPENLLAVSGKNSVEATPTGRVFVQSGRARHEITFLDTGVGSAGSITAAGFSPSGNRLAIAVTGRNGSAVYVGRRTLGGWGPWTWQAVWTFGVVLAIDYEGERDGILTTLERWERTVVRTRYPVDATGVRRLASRRSTR